MKKEQTKVIATRLPLSLIARLEKEASKHVLNLSAYIRMKLNRK